jgi:hypothetical protein
MTDDTLTPSPTWLRVLLVFEALWWLGAVGFGCLFTFVASTFGSPDAGWLGAALGLGLVACVANTAVAAVAVFRRGRRPPGQRFGVIHGTIATVAAGPVAVTFVGVSIFAAQKSVADTVSAILFAAAMVAASVAGLLLARSDRPLASKIGVWLSALACPSVSATLFGVMTSMAVAGGLTV